MGKQHIIELNGKKYDALTGREVSLAPQKVNQSHATAKSMDGFAVPRSHPPRKVSGTSHQPHQPQKAQTLMRHSVRKPIKSVAEPKPKPLSEAVPAASVITDKRLLERAKKSRQSSLIRHFGLDLVSAKTASLSTSAHKTAHNEEHVRHVQKPHPLEQALATASSHTEPRPKRAPVRHRVAKKLRVSPRAINIGAASLAIVLIVGFFVYQNIPNLAMKVASVRANIDGSLPSYRPAGFNLNSAIQYSPGEIKVAYKSNSDDRNFQITQRASEWDSQSLLANYVAPKNQPYQTVQDKGKTVYLYEGNNATWVDGGIWYTIEGNSKLNSQQLQDLAASL